MYHVHVPQYFWYIVFNCSCEYITEACKECDHFINSWFMNTISFSNDNFFLRLLIFVTRRFCNFYLALRLYILLVFILVFGFSASWRQHKENKTIGQLISYTHKIEPNQIYYFSLLEIMLPFATKQKHTVGLHTKKFPYCYSTPLQTNDIQTNKDHWGQAKRALNATLLYFYLLNHRKTHALKKDLIGKKNGMLITGQQTSQTTTNTVHHAT